MLKFLIGIGCGVGLGLLLAPASGEQTREQLKELASRPADLAARKSSKFKKTSDRWVRIWAGKWPKKLWTRWFRKG